MPKQETGAKKSGFSSLSSDKLLQILECLAEYRAPAKLQDIADRLGMAQPTALRYLNSLIQLNYAYKDEETARYAITWKICRIGFMVTMNNSMRDVVSPFLRDLSHQVNLGTCLVAERDDELIYMDVVDRPSTAMQMMQHIGKNAPMHTTGSGKVLLANMPQQRITRFLHEKELVQITKKTITDPTLLIEQLRQVREQGYAIDDEECEDGIRCVSVPLWDYTGEVVAAISIFGTVEQVDLPYIKEELLPPLLETAKIISVRLGQDRMPV